MAAANDQRSGTSAPASGIDPLSDVLRTIKLKGALFFLVDASDPWCVDIPRARAFADIILPGARHVVSYHVMVEGHGLARIPGGDPIALGPGDIVVLPHEDAYVMQSAEGVPPEFSPEETMAFFRALAAGALPFTVTEGGGGAPPARVICGFLGCDPGPGNPLFAAVPRLLHVRRPAGEGSDLLDRLIELTLAEAQADRPGGASIRLGLSEVMFAEVLRRHLAETSPRRPGWLGGLADPVVGRALAALHGEPVRAWTLDGLAAAVGTSRSVLAERFARSTGQTPMRYLSEWRLQLAARLLADGEDKVAAIAGRVGFASEAAFSRAFKRLTGLPPARWRERTARGSAHPPAGS